MAAAAEQPPHRLAQRLAEQVPQRDVDAGDGRQRDAAAAHGGKRPALAGHVVGAGAVVERLPQGGDVAGIAADEERGQLGMDERHDGGVVAEVTDADLGFTQTRQPGIGVASPPGSRDRAAIAKHQVAGDADVVS